MSPHHPFQGGQIQIEQSVGGIDSFCTRQRLHRSEIEPIASPALPHGIIKDNGDLQPRRHPEGTGRETGLPPQKGSQTGIPLIGIAVTLKADILSPVERPLDTEHPLETIFVDGNHLITHGSLVSVQCLFDALVLRIIHHHIDPGSVLSEKLRADLPTSDMGADQHRALSCIQNTQKFIIMFPAVFGISPVTL